MQLTDLRFLQNTQTLLLHFDDGVNGTISLANLSPGAKEITGIAPISPLQIVLYFDGLKSGQIFDVLRLRELSQ
ncbi:MAG: hypothetical protein NTV32_04890 [Gammaproteobacteria bacterium]|nr:hypothetical protein [Gammaproteobacteria bacterium]